jgi:hypothetical protein
MPNKLTNTAARALGQGGKAAKLGGKSPGFNGKLSNTATRSTAKTGKASPMGAELGRTTLKNNTAKTGGKARGY